MRYQMIFIFLVISSVMKAQEKTVDIYLSFTNCISGDRVDYDQPVYFYALPQDSLAYTISTETLSAKGFVKFNNVVQRKYQIVYKGYDGALTSVQHDLMNGTGMISLCYNGTQSPVDSALQLLNTGDSLTVTQTVYSCFTTGSQRISFVKALEGYTATIYPGINKFESLMKDRVPETIQVVSIRDYEVDKLDAFLREVSRTPNAAASSTSVYVITTGTLKWMFRLHNDKWDAFQVMRRSLKDHSAQLVLRH